MGTWMKQHPMSTFAAAAAMVLLAALAGLLVVRPPAPSAIGSAETGPPASNSPSVTRPPSAQPGVTPSSGRRPVTSARPSPSRLGPGSSTGGKPGTGAPSTRATPTPVSWVPFGPADVGSPGQPLTAYARLQERNCDGVIRDVRIDQNFSSATQEEKELYLAAGHACLAVRSNSMSDWADASAHLASAPPPDTSIA